MGGGRSEIAAVGRAERSIQAGAIERRGRRRGDTPGDTHRDTLGDTHGGIPGDILGGVGALRALREVSGAVRVLRGVMSDLTGRAERLCASGTFVQGRVSREVTGGRDQNGGAQRRGSGSGDGGGEPRAAAPRHPPADPRPHRRRHRHRGAWAQRVRGSGGRDSVAPGLGSGGGPAVWPREGGGGLGPLEGIGNSSVLFGVLWGGIGVGGSVAGEDWEVPGIVFEEG